MIARRLRLAELAAHLEANLIGQGRRDMMRPLVL